MFGIRFWGVRGSIACPGRTTARYGGNTSSIQIITDEDYQVLLDLGTGVRKLGGYLLGNPEIKKPLDVYIFLSHTHWDHIMGFPFFVPIHIPTSTIRIMGPVPLDDDLSNVVGGQLSYKYFPVRFDELKSTITYEHLQEGHRELPGGLKISYIYLNHPILTLGYKFEYKGKTIGTCYDHEPFLNLFENDPENREEGKIAADEQNERVISFFKDVDLLVHDAQYTSKQYERFIGWGHSTFKHAVINGVKTGAKKLVLFHHDPERTDTQLDKVSALAAETGKKCNMEIITGYEGLEIFL